ncbi:MAG: 16S rRNA (cytosine(1402)-N(4))-methyltransferase RsmH [Chlamydiae bacterium]|nr:16S rRNA (cytosine(1402)-N(4))-methyltransferase RsmH [Chlamydiota bacterium]
MTKHIPVMLDECLKAFEGERLQYFFDGTLGAGGHASAILGAHPEIEIYIGCDQDPVAIGIATETLINFESKLKIVRSNHVEIEKILKELGIHQIDGCLLDLGVSSMQLDEDIRGFSFQKEGPLDMRMDPSQKLTAKEIINSYSEKDLGRIFREYGEEKLWRRGAKAIVEARKKKRFETTTELAELISQSLPRTKQKLHPATLIFQALRICVNRELETLEGTLKKAIEVLRPGGKIAVISFHSLEDRIVKNVFRAASEPLKNLQGMKIAEPVLENLTKKPLLPSRSQISRNRRSRSAKLRIARKI